MRDAFGISPSSWLHGTYESSCSTYVRAHSDLSALPCTCSVSAWVSLLGECAHYCPDHMLMMLLRLGNPKSLCCRVLAFCQNWPVRHKSGYSLLLLLKHHYWSRQKADVLGFLQAPILPSNGTDLSSGASTTSWPSSSPDSTLFCPASPSASTDADGDNTAEASLGPFPVNMSLLQS